MTTRMFNKPGVLRAWLALALLALVTAAGPAGAVPQVMTAYGDQMAWRQTDVNAMGGTGVAVYRGAVSNIFNPAYLSVETEGRFDASFSLDQEHEDRFQPLFDTFDSYVTDAAIASNRNHFWQGSFGVTKRLQIKDWQFTGALSLVDRYPFQYNFWEELRNPSPFPPGSGEPARDRIIEERRREVTGTLRSLSVGFGSEFNEYVSFGAAMHYSFGTRKDVHSVRDFVDPDESYQSIDKFNMSAVNFTVGARGVVTERVEIGVSWESQLDATGDRTMSLDEADAEEIVSNTVDGYYRYPNIYRVGLTFQPRTDPATMFTMELEYLPFSEMADNANPGYDNPQNLTDVTDVRIGLQHTFYNGMPLRFGFRHFNSYADRDAYSSVFTAGLGMPVGSGMVSASMELGKITSIQDHQFPYPDDYFGDTFVTDPQSRVEDTRFRLGVGCTFYF